MYASSWLICIRHSPQPNAHRRARELFTKDVKSDVWIPTLLPFQVADRAPCFAFVCIAGLKNRLKITPRRYVNLLFTKSNSYLCTCYGVEIVLRHAQPQAGRSG
jgi:hypothetical protein